MIDYYNFLMDDLYTIKEDLGDDDSHISHEICTLLSVEENYIPETFFRLYSANLDIDKSILMNAVSYYYGAGFLKIECDCTNEDKSICEFSKLDDSWFFENGVESKNSKDKKWSSIMKNVSALKKDIFV